MLYLFILLFSHSITTSARYPQREPLPKTTEHLFRIESGYYKRMESPSLCSYFVLTLLRAERHQKRR